MERKCGVEVEGGLREDREVRVDRRKGGKAIPGSKG